MHLFSRRFFVVFVLVALVFDVSASKDRKKKKQQKHDDSQLEEEGLAGGHIEGSKGGNEKETRERVHALVERQEENKKENEEESSEEKDNEKDEKKNGTEIVIPRFKRLTANSALYPLNGRHMQIAPEPNHESQPRMMAGFVRIKRDNEVKTLAKAQEINEGVQLPVSTKPKQDQPKRLKRNSDDIGVVLPTDGIDPEEVLRSYEESQKTYKKNTTS